MTATGNKSKTARAAKKPADVLHHLGESLHRQWRQYRKRLKRCQEHFSAKAVHRSRVETRRLLATVELLCAFIPEREIVKARCALKDHLDSFDRLRDTQVQLIYIEHLVRPFPAARKFREWLREREARYIRETRQAVRRIKTRRLGKRIAAFEKELRRSRKETPPGRAFIMAQGAIRLAFARVAQLCRRVKATDTRTIHRTRVAFKRFRYMVDALSPLLPAVSDEHRQAMRGYQSLMGDIQDVEVLLAALDKFIEREQNDRESLHLRAEFARRREQLIIVYLNASDKLRQFWPVQPKPGRSAPAPTKQP
jgi:CHAD domain-containing protein